MKFNLNISNFMVLMGRGALLLGCLLLSMFIYLNVAEKVLLKDLPWVSSVSSTTLPNFIYQVSQNKVDRESNIGFFGKPIVIRVPIHNFSLSIGEEKLENGRWLVSNHVASWHIYDESQGGNIGSFVVFAAPQSGELAVSDILVEGDIIVIDTDKDWKYSYRVIKRSFMSIKDKYLVSDAPYSKLLIIRDRNNSQATVVEAQFLNIERRDSSV